MMRQLELVVGQEAFRDGLREYLKTYAFGNATWNDLVRILDAKTPEDLAAWSRAWVEERGRPEFRTINASVSGPALCLGFAVTDPLQRGLVWPQRLRVVVGSADGTQELSMSIKGEGDGVGTCVAGIASHAPPRPPRTAPLYVLPNGGGLGYGLFILDERSRKYLLAHLEDIGDPLTRGSAWVTLWDNVVEKYIEPDQFMALVVRALPRETDEQIVQRVLGYTTRAFWRNLTPRQRSQQAPRLEAILRAGIARAATSSAKSAWFSAFRDIATTRSGVAWLEQVWRRDEQIPGLTFAETDEIAMALELAVREVPAWNEILQTQLDRTQNPDRKARFAFVMPALSADPRTREQAFDRLRRVENRRREPWVLESLAYLNHPLRESHARRFVGPSLELLREIQRTGDIFFPGRWMEAALNGHQSAEAAAAVRDFLGRELQYPQRLRWTILSAADDLLKR